MIADLLIPLILAVCACAALRRRENVYDALTDGAAKGLRLLITILPSLIILLTAVNMLRASGMLDRLSAALGPLCRGIGLPPETLPLILVRPFSGSAALGVGSDLIASFGPDSPVGRTAAVMLGSTETTFYTIAVYFGAAGIKKTRYAIPAALCADHKSVLLQNIAESLCDLRAQDRAESAICGRDFKGFLVAADIDAALCRAGRSLFGKSLREGGHEDRHIRCGLQFEIIEILGGIEAARAALFALLQDGHGSLSQDLPHVHFESPVGDQFPAYPQAVRSARHLRHGPEAQMRHEFPHLFRDKEHKAGHMLGASAEAVSEFLVLGGDADGTCVLGTDAHHHAA